MSAPARQLLTTLLNATHGSYGRQGSGEMVTRLARNRCEPGSQDAPFGAAVGPS